jgi:hypothetical protein
MVTTERHNINIGSSHAPRPRRHLALGNVFTESPGERLLFEPAPQVSKTTRQQRGSTRLLMIRERLSKIHTGLHSKTKQIELPTSMPIGVVGGVRCGVIQLYWMSAFVIWAGVVKVMQTKQIGCCNPIGC